MNVHYDYGIKSVIAETVYSTRAWRADETEAWLPYVCLSDHVNTIPQTQHDMLWRTRTADCLQHTPLIQSLIHSSTAHHSIQSTVLHSDLYTVMHWFRAKSKRKLDAQHVAGYRDRSRSPRATNYGIYYPRRDSQAKLVKFNKKVFVKTGTVGQCYESSENPPFWKTRVGWIQLKMPRDAVSTQWRASNKKKKCSVLLTLLTARLQASRRL